ncbi:hypothetical protein TcWFU_008991 [Taenia crassiceps]|uniref:Uncharacterized protein n=1 Tax=Taenia crassiceps TaxID=6207 RepID=A0ABR4QIC9_9CEST
MTKLYEDKRIEIDGVHLLVPLTSYGEAIPNGEGKGEMKRPFNYQGEQSNQMRSPNPPGSTNHGPSDWKPD